MNPKYKPSMLRTKNMHLMEKLKNAQPKTSPFVDPRLETYIDDIEEPSKVFLKNSTTRKSIIYGVHQDGLIPIADQWLAYFSLQKNSEASFMHKELLFAKENKARITVMAKLQRKAAKALSFFFYAAI